MLTSFVRFRSLCCLNHHHVITMEAEAEDMPKQPAITYADIHAWSDAYDLPPERATAAIRDLAHAAYGLRPGLLDRVSRRHCLDLHRLANVLDQLTLLQERDVLALSFRCPTRMLRYQAALLATIARGNTSVAETEVVRDAYRTYEVLCKFTEQVTAFYQGLS